jgi:gamma-glutamyltranspeptidase/glutathione hydrolase
LCCALLGTRAAAASYERGVVVSEHILASDIGVDVLRQGGNAADAAVAASLAVCVLNSSSCGIGGGGFMLIYLTAQKKAVALTNETALARSRDMYVRDGKVDPQASRRGGLAVAVPRSLPGGSALKDGSLPLATLDAARDPPGARRLSGRQASAEVIAQQRDAIHRPELPRTFCDPTARHRRKARSSASRSWQRRCSDRRRRTAGVLRRQRRHGVDAIAAAGGIVSTDDLEAYRPVWRSRSHRLPRLRRHRHAAPSSAGVLLRGSAFWATMILRSWEASRPPICICWPKP